MSFWVSLIYSLHPGEPKCLQQVCSREVQAAEGLLWWLWCSCPVTSPSVGQVIGMSDMLAIPSLHQKVNKLTQNWQWAKGWRNWEGMLEMRDIPAAPQPLRSSHKWWLAWMQRKEIYLGLSTTFWYPGASRSFQVLHSIKKYLRLGVIGMQSHCGLWIRMRRKLFTEHLQTPDLVLTSVVFTIILCGNASSKDGKVIRKLNLRESK